MTGQAGRTPTHSSHPYGKGQDDQKHGHDEQGHENHPHEFRVPQTIDLEVSLFANHNLAPHTCFLVARHSTNELVTPRLGGLKGGRDPIPRTSSQINPNLRHRQGVKHVPFVYE